MRFMKIIPTLVSLLFFGMSQAQTSFPPFSGTIYGAFSAPVRVITSGTTDTVQASDYTISWNSSATSSKAESLPSCSSGNKGRVLIFKDTANSSSIYAIILTPIAGKIEDGVNFYINTVNGQSITIQCDGVSNWMVN